MTQCDGAMPRTTDDHRSCQQYSPMHPHSPVTIATKNTISLCEKYSLPYIYVCVHTNTHTNSSLLITDHVILPALFVYVVVPLPGVAEFAGGH